MSIRIGANPIGWTNDDLQEIGGDTPLETCLAEAKEAGVVGMEKGHKLPSDGAALKDKLGQFGLSFVGGWYSAELLKRSARDEYQAAKSHVAMTKGAGSDIVIVAETSNCIHGDRSKPLSERPRLHKDDWAGYGAKMTEFAERLADEGLKLCYHHHMGTIIQSERDIDALMAHTKPPVHLLLDTGHARWGGADPAALARAYRSRIGHVHCKDVREAKMRESNAGDWSFLDSILGQGKELGVYTVPGDGAIDYVVGVRRAERLFRLGRARGRAGPEESPCPALCEERRRAHPRRDEGSGIGVGREKIIGSVRRGAIETARSSAKTAAADGVGHRITPASAGWRYVGFETRNLKQGAKSKLDTGGDEVCIVILSGKARVTAEGFDSGTIGERASVFDGLPWSVYLPPHSAATIEAASDCELALCSAPASGKFKARVIKPADVGTLTRGTGSNARHVRNVLPEDAEAESVLVVEVITPGGNWSSYPPHKHDRDALPDESYLEETYYHRLKPAAGLRSSSASTPTTVRSTRRWRWATATSCWCRRAIIPSARRTATTSTISTSWRDRSASGAFITIPRMSG